MKTFIFISLGLLSAGLLVASCGSDSSSTAYTCNIDSAKACTSYSGTGASEYETNCTAGSGTWSSTATCSSTSLCGTCTYTSGTLTFVNYYYTGGSSSKTTLQSTCTQLSGTWADQSGVDCN